MSFKLALYETAQRQAAREQYRKRLAQCEQCPFATYTGAHGIWYCPLSVCRHDMPKEEPHHDPD